MAGHTVTVCDCSSMALLHPKDADGNIWTSPHIGIDTSGIICVAPCRKLVATIGVADLIIVDTPDALLVRNKEHEQDVMAVVHSLESGERSIKNNVS
jgi:hypothetical protein